MGRAEKQAETFQLLIHLALSVHLSRPRFGSTSDLLLHKSNCLWMHFLLERVAVCMSVFLHPQVCSSRRLSILRGLFEENKGVFTDKL